MKVIGLWLQIGTKLLERRLTKFFLLHLGSRRKLESFLCVSICATTKCCHHVKHFKCPLAVSGCLACDIISYQHFFGPVLGPNPVLVIANSEDILIWETFRICTDVIDSLHQCHIFVVFIWEIMKVLQVYSFPMCLLFMHLKREWKFKILVQPTMNFTTLCHWLTASALMFLFDRRGIINYLL